MQLLSYSFIILWVLTFALYYLVPGKKQWYVLLAASVVFYLSGLRGIPVSLFLTGITTYACGIFVQKNLEAQKAELEKCSGKEQKKEVRARFAGKRKRGQILHFVINIGLLVFYKYAVITLPFLRGITGDSFSFPENVMMPLGISFYTLTAISYVIDVGRENCETERNFWKVLLFLSYFPAVTQGPFHRFSQMREQFDRGHTFDYERMVSGIQRFIQGAFKKLVIADRLGIFVDNVFREDAALVPGSVYACAVVFYMLQLYADFSGYIDMAMGVSETFDIVLPENFKRPYFSKSVAEFWRRWHITLGAWFKDYIMFSFVMSGTGRRIGRAFKKKHPHYGKQAVPVIGTMLVWFLTGLWHGRTYGYLVWGIYYGVIMSVSLLAEEHYAAWKRRLHMKDGRAYQLFCMIRTWCIVFAADILIRSADLRQAGNVFAALVTRLEVTALLSKTITSYGLNKFEFLILFAALAVWFAVSLLEERGKDVRCFLAERTVFVRWLCYYGIVLFLLITGIYGGSYDTAAFMYQSF